MPHRLSRHLVASAVVALAVLMTVPPSAASTPEPSGAATPEPTGSASPRVTTGSTVGGALLASPGVVVSRPPGVQRLPRADAKAFVVADLDTREVLAAKAAHRRLRPASTLKVLTALTVLPQLDQSDTYVATYEDAAVEGAKVGLYPGGRYTVEQLFRSMIIASGNDSARALANAAGGVPRTIRRMNSLAERLQALDTTAVNPTGLDARNQFSSAYDLALLGRAAMANPRMRSYATMVKTTLPARRQTRPRARSGQQNGPRPRPTYEVWTINRLLLNYRGAIGLKTGWTTLAGGTYIGVARRNGRTLLVSVMGSRGDSWEAAATLLDWGFSAAERVEPVGVLVNPVTPSPAATPTTTAKGTVRAAGDDSVPRGDEAGSSSTATLTWPVAVLVGLAVPIAWLRASARRRRRRGRRRL